MRTEQVVDKVKLHLGCGKRYLKGYIHIDLDSSPHVDHNQDIRELPMFEDKSVDLIYSCGAIVYFDREEVRDVLREWYRVLRPGGILRTSVPNFEAIVDVYIQGGRNLDARGILGPLYGKWGITRESTPTFIYQKTTYDYQSLEKILRACGLKHIKQYDWWDVLPPDYDDYSMAYIPHMDQENGLLISLNVQAER